MTALLILMSSVLAALGQGSETDWKVGLAKVDITPAEPVFLAGYASRDKPFDAVEAKLFAKAIALTDRNGDRAVLITTDLIGFSAAVSDPICERIIAEAGLERSQILINSSHIHTGPEVTLDSKEGDKLDAGQKERQITYTKGLQDKIVNLALEALNAEPQPVVLSLGTGMVNFVMNRREFTADRGVILGVNPRGPVDRSVPVLRIATPGDDGELLAVVYQAACHNTTLGSDFYRISGDYAGYSQAHVELAFPGVQAMFMLGCAGDANPHPRDNKIETAQRFGTELGEAVAAVLKEPGRLKPIRGPLKTAFSKASLPLQPLPSKAELSEMRLSPGGWRGWVADGLSKYHLPDADPFPRSYEAPFSVWQFGDDLTLVGLSGEVVVDYVQILERELGPLNLWIAAYCNDVYGYLPSARVLREGGYETRGLYYGYGFFSPEVETVVAKEIRKLAEQTGREMPKN